MTIEEESGDMGVERCSFIDWNIEVVQGTNVVLATPFAGSVRSQKPTLYTR